MKTYLEALRCAETGDPLPFGELLNLSPAGKPIVCDYDLPRLRGDVDRDALLAPERTRGVWRWRELLPLPLDQAPVSLGEGDTPLVEAPRIADELGVARVWIKDESQNPTGSFKARGMTAAVTMAAHFGATCFTVPSAGNAGGALAAYAAAAGLPAHVFVPADTPEVNRLEVSLYGGNLHLVDGLIDQCGREAAAAREDLGAFDVSTLKEPYRIEGKKTMGLELAAQRGWKLPSVVIYPTGGGTGLVGMDRAFNQLRDLGWLDDSAMPRLVSVQSTGCAPIVRAFEKGETHAPKWENAETRAFGLRVPGAIGDFLILDALRRSGGTAIAVPDADLLRDMVTLASASGVCACPEGGATLSAAKQMAANGQLNPDDEVVLFNTGAAPKYLEVLREALT